MQLSAGFVLLLSLLQGSIYTQASTMNNANQMNPPAQEVSVVSTSTSGQKIDFNPNNYRWQHRLVLLFAPSQSSTAYQQQIKTWQAHRVGVSDRDLKLVEVLATGESRVDGQPITATSAESLRQQYKIAVNDFVVILVGKDGTAKQRSRTPFDLTVLFRTIDAMPMRQQEMHSR